LRLPLARELLKELVVLEGKFSVVRAKIEELTVKKENLSELGAKGKCPTCFQDLGEKFEDVMRHITEELAGLEGEFREISGKKKEASGKVKEINGKIQALVGRKNELFKSLKEKSALAQAIREQEKELANIDRALREEKKRFAKVRDVSFDEEAYGKLLEDLNKEGYSRARVNKKIMRTDEKVKLERYKKHDIEVVIDRLNVNDLSIDDRSRLVDSLETALKLGILR